MTEPSKAEIALMVYDATLYCLLPFIRDLPECMQWQVEAARDAHLWATGEESMCQSLITEKPSNDPS